MDSILQTLKQLMVDLEKVELVGKPIGEFLEVCRSLTDQAILELAQHRIQEIDRTIGGMVFHRGDWVVVKRGVPRTLETKLGPLCFSRRYYRDTQTKEYCFLSDVVIGIHSHQRVEDHLMLGLIQAAAKTSYRQASAEVCEGRVSATKVMQSIRQLEIPETPPQETKRRVQELHIQADEDHVHLQQARRKSGQIRFAAIHEPKVRVGEERYRLPQRHILSSVEEKPEAFGERLLDTLDALYELDQVETLYCHGDGAGWIAAVREQLPKSVPIYDHFHLEKALLSVCQGERRLRSRLRSCLHPWDDAALQTELQMLVDSCVCTQEKADKLWVTLQNNREGILNNFTLQHGGSCAEGLVSHIFSKRFSRDPLAWSVQSLRKLSHIRSHLENGGTLEPTMLWPVALVEEKTEPVVQKAVTQLAARKKQDAFDWSVPIPGRENTGGALGSILKSILHRGYPC